MKPRIKAGLLPLFLELYDRVFPERRESCTPLLENMEKLFSDCGVDLQREAICCRKEEIYAAVRRLDASGVDVIITLHLAYSPSLESIDALVQTRTPLLLLDTTMDFSFGNDTLPERIGFNHGIHGVQDLASVLRRRRRHFQVVAGHITESDVIPRAAAMARAAAAARRLNGMRVLRIGPSFTGMGDFFVEERVLKSRLHVEVVQQDIGPITTAAHAIDAAMVREEMARDRGRYQIEVDDATHAHSVRAGLALAQVMEDERCGACTINFLAFESGEPPLATVPFLGASKAMANGCGYAGEGDVLTAALMGALNAYFLANFTEMFCPDWKGNSLFLSHMGEFNPACAEGPVRMVEKPFPWTGAVNPAILTGAMTRGRAVLVNLAPRASGHFALLAAQVDVLDDATQKGMRDCVRGWIRPAAKLSSFLEWYSEAGGTHHCALVHDESVETLRSFAGYCGILFESPD